VIRISKKLPRGDDGHRTISLRVPIEILKQIEDIANETDRSRNELINILLSAALQNVKIEQEEF